MAPIINTISIGDIYLNNVWEENKYDMFQKKSTSTSEYYGQRQQTDARTSENYGQHEQATRPA